MTEHIIPTTLTTTYRFHRSPERYKGLESNLPTQIKDLCGFWGVKLNEQQASLVYEYALKIIGTRESYNLVDIGDALQDKDLTRDTIRVLQGMVQEQISPNKPYFVEVGVFKGCVHRFFVFYSSFERCFEYQEDLQFVGWV